MNLAEQLTSFNLSECYSDLMFVARAAPRRASPAYTQVVFTTDGNNRLIAGTSRVDLTAICKTEIIVAVGGPVAVDATQLIRALRAIGPTGRVEFTRAQDDPVLRLTNGDMTVNLTGFANSYAVGVAEMMSKVRKSCMKSRRVLEQSQSWLLNHLTAVKPAISTEDTRYYLNGICLQTDDQKHLLLTTADGHRLHHNKTDAQLPKELPSSGVIMDKEMLPPLLRLLDKKSNQPVTLRINMQADPAPDIFAMVGNITLCSVAIEGVFPEWQRVVPKGDNKQVVTFDRSELLRALAPMPSGYSTNPVIIHVLPGTKGTYLSVRTTEGYAARTRISSNASADQPMTASYKNDYLLAALRSVTSDTITLTLFTPKPSAVVDAAYKADGWDPDTNREPAILDATGTDDLRVLMPMRPGTAEAHFARTGSLEPEQKPDIKQAA